MRLRLFLLCLMTYVVSYSQDCINYWKFNEKINDTYNYTNNYFIVPEGCLSKLISQTESMELNFDLIKGRDYKIRIGTEMPDGKALIKIYNTENNVLLYDNSLNDTAAVVEFEIIETRHIKAVVTLTRSSKKTNDKNRYYEDIIVPKINRYCVGIRLETMITHK